MRRCILPALLVPLWACESDQGINELLFENIAMTTGDFDQMSESLIRMDIGYTEFEGLISQAVYDTEMDPSMNSLKVETLLQGADENNNPVLLEYDAAFLNSGTRGLGSVVYNGLEDDNGLLEDPQVAENLNEFMRQGRTLVVSDWAGDLIEAVWPDRIQFVDEEDWDASQVGTSEAVIADVVDAGVEAALGTNNVEVSFDFTYWTAMESVASDVDVYLRGDIEYRMGDAEGYGTLSDVPLLVGFTVDRGRVIFSSFHWRVQNPAMADMLMLSVVNGLIPGTNSAYVEEANDAE
jgi:hypothetical protein